MISDSHCHLDFPDLYNQLDDIVKRADKNNVKYLLSICTTLQSFKKIELIIQRYKNIFGTFKDLLLIKIKFFSLNSLLSLFKILTS